MFKDSQNYNCSTHVKVDKTTEIGKSFTANVRKGVSSGDNPIAVNKYIITYHKNLNGPQPSLKTLK